MQGSENVPLDFMAEDFGFRGHTNCKLGCLRVQGYYHVLSSAAQLWVWGLGQVHAI